MIPDIDKIHDDLFNRYIELFKDMRKESSENSFFLDKAMLTISSGAIGLLLASLESITKVFGFEYLDYLIYSIQLFGITIAAVVFSFIAARHAFPKFRPVIEKWYRDNTEKIDSLPKTAGAERQKLWEEINKNPQLKNWLTFLSGVFNIIGAVAITLAFSYLFIFITVSSTELNRYSHTTREVEIIENIDVD